MFYLTTHSTHFIVSYPSIKHKAMDYIVCETGNLLLPTVGHSFLLTAKDLLHASSNEQDSTYHQSWSTGWNGKNH